MPRKINEWLIGKYIVYFQSHDGKEPIHVHTSDQPSKHEGPDAKIWLKIDGSTEIASYGRVPKKDFPKIQKYLTKNHIRIFHQWQKLFGYLEFKDNPGILFIITIDNNIISKSDKESVLPDLKIYEKDLKFATYENRREIARQMIIDGYRDIELIKKYTWLREESIYELIKEFEEK